MRAALNTPMISAKLLIRLSALLGIIASLYALYIEHEMSAAAALGTTYTASCDFAGFASCSKVLSSSYARILSHWRLVPRGSSLDLSNALLGAVFYVFALLHDSLLLPTALAGQLLLVGAVGSLGFALYLAYILKFVLGDFCLVCVACKCVVCCIHNFMRILDSCGAHASRLFYSSLQDRGILHSSQRTLELALQPAYTPRPSEAPYSHTSHNLPAAQLRNHVRGDSGRIRRSCTPGAPTSNALYSAGQEDTRRIVIC